VPDVGDTEQVRVGTEDRRAGLAADLDEMVAATERLVETARGLDADAVRGASRLPGWTRAHVLTHVARNADGYINLVTWARTGVETPVYPSPEARAADIEAGAHRTPGDLELDLNESAERLLAAFAAEPFDDAALDRELRLPSGSTLRGWEIARRRIREVEIHHTDLDAGYAAADWPAAFVARTLDELAPLFRAARETPVGQLVATDSGRRWDVAESGPALSGTAAGLLDWLTGRSPGADLSLDEGGPVPPAPRWA